MRGMRWRWAVPETRRARHWHHRARYALRHSLRLKLVLVFLLLALTTTAIFLAGTQRAIGMGWRQAVAPLLGDYVDRLVAEIGSPPSVERAKALTARLPLSVRIDGPAVHWSSSGKKQYRDDWDDPGEWRRDSGPRLLERVTADGHRVVLGLGDLSWKSQPRLIGWFTLGMLLVITALAYGYLRRLLRPLDDIRAGAQRFGRGAFDQPIAVRWRDELGDLAAQINTMAQDIQKMLDGKRALLLAISHELRSPLTRARLNAELLPEVAETQGTREALLRDLAEMRDLITDLLESERLSDAHVALHLERVDIANLVHEVLTSRSAFAPVRVEIDGDARALVVDQSRFRLALRNLLDNALRYGGEGRDAPTLSLAVQARCLKLVVRDFGPGVKPEQLPHLAEPFYRTDTARQRSTGGVGLGLYLSRLVAQAHGGSLVFCNADPGLEATLTLPLLPLPSAPT